VYQSAWSMVVRSRRNWTASRTAGVAKPRRRQAGYSPSARFACLSAAYGRCSWMSIPGEDVTGDGADAEGLYQRGARELRMALVSLMGAAEGLRRWPEMSSAYSAVSTPTRAMRPSASAWMPHP